MKVHKAYRFRIYPNNKQGTLIAKTIGSARFVFNHFLDKWNTTYKETGKGLNYYTCSSELPQLKNEFEWLKEIDSIALQSIIRNLADSFSGFFKKQTKRPRFKSKKNRVQSYTTRHVNNNIAIIDNKIKLPKLGLVKFAKSREVEGRIINATIRRNPSGKHFVSILVETKIDEWPKTNSTVGMDVGLIDFAVLSNGKKYDNPKPLRNLENKLAKAQRTLSRRKNGSSNWHKQRIKVARIHEKISNTRLDYLHKVSTEVIKSHDVISIEDLQVTDMLKNKQLAKSISDASWSLFRTLLIYKADWYGKQVVVVDRHFPSSQLCSNCNTQHSFVKDLHIRKWQCPDCHMIHDREENAAINIKNEAVRLLTVGPTGLA